MGLCFLHLVVLVKCTHIAHGKSEWSGPINDKLYAYAIAYIRYTICISHEGINGVVLYNNGNATTFGYIALQCSALAITLQ